MKTKASRSFILIIAIFLIVVLARVITGLDGFLFFSFPGTAQAYPYLFVDPYHPYTGSTPP